MEAMQIVKVIRYAARLILAVAIGLALVGFLPAATQANTNPVELELGDEGATPWVISNIKPGDSGTKTVELHNVGSKDGFVTIWVDDIVSSEGVNPESETGDTSGPGEFDDHLLLNLSVDGITTNLNLPATINDLPQSASWSQYIEVVPIKAGEIVNLQWEWELPTQTSNEVQGDIITFTTNYLLQEFEVTDVSEVVTEEGVFTEEVTVVSEAGNGKITIEEDITGQTEEGEPPTEIWLIEIGRESSAPSEDTATVGSHYEAGPDGTTFDQPVIITLHFDPTLYPERSIVATLVIVVWDKDAGEWVELENCTVDWTNYTISAPVTHFSRYTITVQVSPPPPAYYPAYLPVEEKPEEEEPPPTTTAKLELNILGQESTIEIGAAGTLSEPLMLIDPSGDFIIDMDSGARISAARDAELSLIELRITDVPIVVPDDMVILSPVYKLTGYTSAMEVTQINFEPYARLTIRYDPQNLPENIFLPFIANYADEQGLVRLQPPPDATVERGAAKALINHASLFVVVAEVAPPPPPLPAKFEASNLTINPQESQLGQPITVSLTVTNEGETEGSFELHLIIDGIVQMVKEITLSGNSSETLTFELSNLTAGKHQVKIAGLTEQFKVVMTPTPPGEDRVNWLVIDVSVGAALVIGALVLYFVTRRLRQARSSVAETSSGDDDGLL